MEIKDLTYSTTSENVFKKLEEGNQTFYLGVDPTSDSLHIGHLSTLIFAKRLIQKGNNFIIVIGGLTAMIGDPSGKKQERQLLDEETIKNNVAKLSIQFKNFFCDKFKLVNNMNWLNKNIIEFLRDYGKNFNVNTMIKRDIVSSRLETGISFTEFTYQILQGIDFAHLAEKNGCTIQIGGQDQWGNIVSGLELIRKRGNVKEAYGVTIPLITKADGTKFGKTESGTIWINSDRTSPYQLYQFLYNTTDIEVVNLIKYLTLATQSQINNYQERVKQNSKKREAQLFLAEEVVKFVYDQKTLDRVKEITKALFSGDIKNLALKEINQCLFDVPKINLKHDLDIQDLLVEVGAAKSRREARDFISNGSIMINGEKVLSDELVITKKLALYNSLHIIKRGKRKYFVAKY